MDRRKDDVIFSVDLFRRLRRPSVLTVVHNF